MFTLAEQPGALDARTACESWQVKDVIGHVVDTTEGYFMAFDTARAGADAPDAHGLLVMHEMAGSAARALAGELSQQEMRARARADLDKMMGILQPLSAEEWGGLIVTHAYMGPVPAFIYAAGQLMDYGVQFESLTEAHFRTTGPAGDLMIAIAAWIAKQERIRISERTKAGVARARAQAKHCGRPVVIFRRDRARNYGRRA